jgi:hypothetical protein
MVREETEGGCWRPPGTHKGLAGLDGQAGEVRQHAPHRVAHASRALEEAKRKDIEDLMTKLADHEIFSVRDERGAALLGRDDGRLPHGGEEAFVAAYGEMGGRPAEFLLLRVGPADSLTNALQSQGGRFATSRQNQSARPLFLELLMLSDRRPSQPSWASTNVPVFSYV